jgi:hypothetical protein
MTTVNTQYFFLHVRDEVVQMFFLSIKQLIKILTDDIIFKYNFVSKII